MIEGLAFAQEDEQPDEEMDEQDPERCVVQRQVLEDQVGVEGEEETGERADRIALADKETAADVVEQGDREGVKEDVAMPVAR